MNDFTARVRVGVGWGIQVSVALIIVAWTLSWLAGDYLAVRAAAQNGQRAFVAWQQAVQAQQAARQAPRAPVAP